MKYNKTTCNCKFIFSFFCLLLFCHYVFAARDQQQKYYLIIDRRPSQPQFYPQLKNYNLKLTCQGTNPTNFPVTVTRHHIIPLNLLRDFFNAVVEEKNRTKKFRRFFLTFAQRIPCYIISSNLGPAFLITHFNEIQGVRLLCKRLGAGTIQPGGERPPAYYDDFQKFYAWMPWNLFIGPSGGYRTDDPGYGFEFNARYIVNNICIWKRIEQLTHLMISYINHPNVRNNPRTYEAINCLLSNLVVSRRTPYPLKAQQWVRTHNLPGGKPQYFIRITHI